MEAQTHAATSLLARLLLGLSQTTPISTLGTANTQSFAAPVPDFSMDDIEETGPGAMSAKVILPTGDTYLVTVAWLTDESP